MPVSSSCVFHYTNKPTTLYKILKDKMFLPSYCREKSGLDRSTYVRVPMVSFCDVPLTQAANITSYGKFAIGMKMDWVVKNRLNPVFYLPENSLVFERNKKLVEEFAKNIKVEKMRQTFINFSPATKLILMLSGYDFLKNPSKGFEIPKNILEPIKNMDLTFFQNIKETIGTLSRGSKEIINYKFYDEREWRFIPQNSDNNSTDFPPYIEEETWIKSESKKFGKKPHFSPKYGLRFKPFEIDYIIVDNEKRILPLISKLKKLFPDNYEVLLTKISTFERIKKDF